MNEEKVNVCRALAAMFSQNDEVTDEEMAFVGQAALHLALDEGELKTVQQALATSLDFSELASTISDPALRRFFFARVVAAALTDEQLSDSEKALVEKTAEIYGWSKGDVNEYVSLQTQALELDRKAQDILGKLG